MLLGKSSIEINYLGLKFILMLCLWLPSINSNAQIVSNDSTSTKLKAFRATPNYKQDTLYIDFLYELARKSAIYDLDSLSKLAKETIDLSKSINYTKGEAIGYLSMGSYYSETGQREKAIESFSKALDKAKSINEITHILRAKNLLAIEYEYNEEYAKALREYLEGIELAKQTKSYNNLSTFYVNISNLYSSQKEMQQCIYFLKLAQENNKLVNDDYIKGLTLANLAASYIDINDLETAGSYVDESISIFDKINLESWQMYAYELKAIIYNQQNQPSLALQWFKKSEKIHESIDQTRYKIPLYNGIAKAYYKLEDFKTSEGYALKALEISKTMNLLEDRDITLQILYDINKTVNAPIKALTYLEDLKTLSDTLNIKKNERELRILKSNLEFDQEKERYIIENEKKVTQQKYYFYAALFVLLSALVIIFILRRNNTVQNRLNNKLTQQSIQLKKKETFLRNSNNTKSRLFSIIAHDLKGPINSFKSMFDLVNSGDMSSSDFMNFAPSMSKNINNISFTLDNLLSWGQSQMDGMVTKQEVTNIKSIVDENIGLLSKSFSQKSIIVESKIDNHVLTWSDKNQIGIVIRNILSNALKFTPENGTITIGANDKNEFWEIWFQDTGVGLTKESLEKIFFKEETFTTYGTNNEKGTGLGLMLCKEMVEKNEGSLRAESIVGKGTCFYCTIPKASDKLKDLT